MDVIIPTTGSRIAHLEDCIKSLKAQTCVPNVLVVLGTRSFEISQNVKELCEKYEVTKLCEPWKPNIKGSKRAVACNYGLEHTHNSYVGFVDDDVVVPPTWIETAIKYFKDDTVAGVTSGCQASESPFHKVQNVGSDGHAKQFDKKTSIKSIPGYNSIYRRIALDRAGMFNETIGGCEDWELNFRLRKLGYKLLGIPEQPVIHRHTYSAKSFIKQMYGYGWSRSHLFKKAHTFTPQHALPAVGMLVIFALALFNHEYLLYALGSYTVVLMSLIMSMDIVNPVTFVETFITFVVMHISWALGYLKGLIL